MLNATPNDRHESAQAGRGMDALTGGSRLERLGESGELGGNVGMPDIRGWVVKASDGRRIGKVHDVLLDTRARRVRWLDVEIDRANVRSGEARCVLVPVGAAQVDDARQEVRLPHLSGAAVARLPGCEHGPLSRERERDILSHLPANADAPADDTDFYAQPHFHY